MTTLAYGGTTVRTARAAQHVCVLAALLMAGAACSSGTEDPSQSAQGASIDTSYTARDGGTGGLPVTSGFSQDGGASVVIEVPADSRICAVNLPFKAPGCPCNGGETAACWTGAADKRGVGKCHDGVQTCQLGAEFGSWGPCTGEQLDCGQPPTTITPPAKEEECGCIPGQVVGCDEDCSAMVFCAPFSSKVCQPDGKFGPCRESLLPTVDGSLACLNVFFGCLPGSTDGIYVGDCGKAFTCGHPPGTTPPADTGTSTADAGAPRADAGTSSIL